MSQLELGMLVMPATGMPLNGAVISPCSLYRYILTRTWDPSLTPLVFCMLNPSTADAFQNDPTIRKCIGFARRMGHGGIVVVNLFAYRSTNPDVLNDPPVDVDMIGPDNDAWIKHAFGLGSREPVLAWGSFAHGAVPVRVQRVVELAHQMAATTYAIGVNEKSNTPRHPLMTAYATPRQKWPPVQWSDL